MHHLARSRWYITSGAFKQFDASTLRKSCRGDAPFIMLNVPLANCFLCLLPFRRGGYNHAFPSVQRTPDLHLSDLFRRKHPVTLLGSSPSFPGPPPPPPHIRVSEKDVLISKSSINFTVNCSWFSDTNGAVKYFAVVVREADSK